MDEYPNLTALVPRILAGDEEAIEQLVHGAFRGLMTVARRTGAATDEDAEEAANDALFNTLRRLPELTFDDAQDSDPLFSYLARAAAQRVRERYRTAQRERSLLTRIANVEIAGPTLTLTSEDVGRPLWSETGSHPPSTTPSPQIVALRGFLDTLSEDDRLMINLRSDTTLTWDEIATHVGLTSAAARKRWQRLRDRALLVLSHVTADEVSVNVQPR